jgi:hypothetical protein
MTPRGKLANVSQLQIVDLIGVINALRQSFSSIPPQIRKLPSRPQCHFKMRYFGSYPCGNGAGSASA